METKGGFYITQIKQLQERIFERLLAQNDIQISGGQGRILFILWKKDHLTVSEISRQTIISLTDYAKSLQDRYETVSQQMNDLFYEGFSVREQQEFEKYLSRILDTLTKAEI